MKNSSAKLEFTERIYNAHTVLIKGCYVAWDGLLLRSTVTKEQRQMTLAISCEVLLVKGHNLLIENVGAELIMISRRSVNNISAH